jgi:5'-3' exonuclease
MDITSDTNAICCTIDKDLLQVEGWHYGWGTHNKAERELHYVDSWGKLEMRGKKLYGEGVMWLYAQAIMGDSTDNIKGIHGAADKKAFELLQDKTTEIELYDTVLEIYTLHFEQPEERLEENMHLLYMCRGWEDGKLIHWKKPL